MHSQFGCVRVTGADVLVLDVIPAAVHVEPVSRLRETTSGKENNENEGKVKDIGGLAALDPGALMLYLHMTQLVYNME